MQDMTLHLQKREITGKAVKQLRKQGLVPAVVHNHGKESIVAMGDYQTLFKAYQEAGKHHPVTVKAGDKTFTTLIKSVTFDPHYNAMTHIVFNAVNANQKVEAEIPVRIRFDEGNDASPAERAGLIVLHQLEAVEVEALPKDLPDALEFDGEKLVEVGDQATVADLIVPANVVVKVDPNQTLATVFEPSALAAANDAAGGTADDDVPADTESEEAEGDAAAAGASDASAEKDKKE